MLYRVKIGDTRKIIRNGQRTILPAAPQDLNS